MLETWSGHAREAAPSKRGAAAAASVRTSRLRLQSGLMICQPVVGRKLMLADLFGLLPIYEARQTRQAASPVMKSSPTKQQSGATP